MHREAAPINSKPIFDAEMGGPSGKLQKIVDTRSDIDPDPHFSPLYGDHQWDRDYQRLVGGRHGFPGGYQAELDDVGGVSYHRGGIWTNHLGKRTPIAHVIKPVLAANPDRMVASDPDQEVQYLGVSSIPGDEGQVYRTLQEAVSRPQSLGNRWEHPGRGYEPRPLSPGFRAQQRRTAALTVENHQGTEGNNDHITRNEYGTVPLSWISRLHGGAGERPDEHRNSHGLEWENFKNNVAAGTPGYSDPIFIVVKHGDDPKIYEGNHRRDAYKENARAAGQLMADTEVPVQVRYFGHAEKQGDLGERFMRRSAAVVPGDTSHGLGSGHTAPASGPTMDNPEDYLPDIYDHPEHYVRSFDRRDPSIRAGGLENWRAVRDSRGNPDHLVNIYRAVPHGVTDIEGNTNPRGASWVSASPSYAKRHAEAESCPSCGGDMQVIHGVARAGDLHNEGYLEEWGYTGDPIHDPSALTECPEGAYEARKAAEEAFMKRMGSGFFDDEDDEGNPIHDEADLGINVNPDALDDLHGVNKALEDERNQLSRERAQNLFDYYGDDYEEMNRQRDAEERARLDKPEFPGATWRKTYPNTGLDIPGYGYKPIDTGMESWQGSKSRIQRDTVPLLDPNEQLHVAPWDERKLEPHMKRLNAAPEERRDWDWEEAPPGRGGPQDRPDDNEPVRKIAYEDYPEKDPGFMDLGKITDDKGREYNVHFYRGGSDNGWNHEAHAIDPTYQRGPNDDPYESVIKWDPDDGEISWRGAARSHKGGFLSMHLKNHLMYNLPNDVHPPLHSTSLSSEGSASLREWLNRHGDIHGDIEPALGLSDWDDDNGYDDDDDEEVYRPHRGRVRQPEPEPDPDELRPQHRRMLENHGFEEDGVGEWNKDFNDPVTGDTIESHNIMPDGRLYVYGRGLDGRRIRIDGAGQSYGDVEGALEKSRQGFAERHLPAFGWTPHYREPAFDYGGVSQPPVNEPNRYERADQPYKWTKATETPGGTYHSTITMPPNELTGNPAYVLNTTREHHNDKLEDYDGDLSGNLLYKEDQWVKGRHPGGREDFRLSHPEFHQAVQETFGRPANWAAGTSPNGNYQHSTPEDYSGRFGPVDDAQLSPEDPYSPNGSAQHMLKYDWEKGRYVGHTPNGAVKMPGKQLQLFHHAAVPDESGLKAAGIAVIALDTGRVLMQQRALNPLHCPCGLGVTWDEQNGYQHDDGSVSHDGEYEGQSVSDLLDQGHTDSEDDTGADQALSNYNDLEDSDAPGFDKTAALEFDPNEGTWEFPGGKLDPGESPRDAAIREFREEVGQDLPSGVFVGAWVSPGGISVTAAEEPSWVDHINPGEDEAMGLDPENDWVRRSFAGKNFLYRRGRDDGESHFIMEPDQHTNKWVYFNTKGHGRKSFIRPEHAMDYGNFLVDDDDYEIGHGRVIPPHQANAGDPIVDGADPRAMMPDDQYGIDGVCPIPGRGNDQYNQRVAAGDEPWEHIPNYKGDLPAGMQDWNWDKFMDDVWLNDGYDHAKVPLDEAKRREAEDTGPSYFHSTIWRPDNNGLYRTKKVDKAEFQNKQNAFAAREARRGYWDNSNVFHEYYDHADKPCFNCGEIHDRPRTAAAKGPVYKGFIYLIQRERDIDLGNRELANPDDPDGDMSEQSAWWEIEHAKDNPALRPEVRDGTPWDELELWADKSVRENKQIKEALAKLAVDQTPAQRAAQEWLDNNPEGFTYWNSNISPDASTGRFDTETGRERTPETDRADEWRHNNVRMQQAGFRYVAPSSPTQRGFFYRDSQITPGMGQRLTEPSGWAPYWQLHQGPARSFGHSDYPVGMHQNLEDALMNADYQDNRHLTSEAATKCSYCKSPATKEIKHSEGMGLIAVCDKHLAKGKAAAENCTPDGTRDPSNINWIHEASVQKLAITWIDRHPAQCGQGCMVKKMKLMDPHAPVNVFMTDHRPHGGLMRWRVTGPNGLTIEGGRARNDNQAESDMLDAYSRATSPPPVPDQRLAAEATDEPWWKIRDAEPEPEPAWVREHNPESAIPEHANPERQLPWWATA